MAKAKDLLGKAGAGGFGPATTSQPKPATDAPAESRGAKKSAQDAPRAGQQAGGGKAPVTRRPKV